MAKVFISYARENEKAAESIAEAIRNEGNDPWWDKNLPGHRDFSEVLEEEIDDSDVGLVLWSKHSVKSQWVRAEADISRSQRKLIQVSLDGTLPPLPFNQIHCIDLKGSRQAAGHRNWPKVSEAIEAIVEGRGVRPGLRSGGRTNLGWQKLGALVMLILFAGMVSLFVLRSGGNSGADELPAVSTSNRPSIAVLPFSGTAERSEEGFFAQGLAEEIYNVLVRVDGLRLASRSSSFGVSTAEMKNLEKVARDLGVRHLLLGNVRRSGQTIRVNVQLINPEANEEIWAETFDRSLNMTNVFAIQEEIAEGIVSVLGEQMSLGHADALKFAAAADTQNFDAYAAFLQGQSLFNARTTENYQQIISAYRAATRLDPNFGRAWIALAGAYSVASSFVSRENYSSQDYPRKAELAVSKALELAPELSMTHTVAANVSLMRGYNASTMARAMSEFNRALELDPDDPLALNWRAQLKAVVGDFQGAERDTKRAIAIDSSDTVAHELLVALHLYQQDLDGALAAQRTAGRYLPTLSDALALALARDGRLDESRQVTRLLRGRWTDYQSLIERIAAGRVNPADAESQMKEVLPKLGDHVPTTMTPFRQHMIRQFDLLADAPEGNFPLYWMRTWPQFLTHPARYENMMKRNLGDYWKRFGYPSFCEPIDTLPSGRNFECH